MFSLRFHCHFTGDFNVRFSYDIVRLNPVCDVEPRRFPSWILRGPAHALDAQPFALRMTHLPVGETQRRYSTAFFTACVHRHITRPRERVGGSRIGERTPNPPDAVSSTRRVTTPAPVDVGCLPFKPRQFIPRRDAYIPAFPY